MTWLGKILLVMVMLLTLFWVWLTATDFATRVNWKTQADAYKKAYEEARDARGREYASHVAERDSLYRKAESFEKELVATKSENLSLAKAKDETRALYDQQSKAMTALDLSAERLQAALNGSLKELESVRERNNNLENETIVLRVQRDGAVRDRLAFQNEARLNRQIADDFARKNDDLTVRVNQLIASGGRAGGTLDELFNPSIRLPENLRGTVTAVEPSAPDLVELSIGIDAGLGFGSELDIYRLTGGGKHLGTVVVTNVYPKKSVARFKPASGQPLNRLKPDELPKAGDIVSRLGTPGAAGALGFGRLPGGR